jgi:peptidoglycan hydrolase-like protein with peptidoglycan-binding domain
MVLSAPYIPETIVVHLGYPDAQAENVTVSFLDYIKNVASSEIYPTWPEEALRANIYAQISYTLNRVFTEWYRSQGYNFDITSVTQFDHAFVYERNVFDTISLIVDEIFTTYIRKVGQVAPFPAPYCDGRRTVCDGMLQWGSVDLAEQGYSAFEILQYYYGDDIELVSNTPVLSYTPSYPGSPVDYGDYNNYVLTIQYQLNRISENYPAIPKISPVIGDFNLVTLSAVRKFQSIFNLAVTGVVDEATWYQISYIYTVVKRLSELETEGVEYSSISKIIPTEIGLGYTGDDVRLLQYFLSVIGLFNSTYPEVKITGVYDEATEEAVQTIQRDNELPVTGNVDKETWDMIYDLFKGITFILPVLYTFLPLEPYDGVILKQGSSGDRVELLQEYLNAIAETYTDIPTVEVLGVFGPQTYNSVVAFQKLFGLTVDGIVGEATWQALLDVYESTLRRENPEVPQYPGYPLLEGMSD